MRDIERIPRIMRRLEALWLQNPDMRFGQLVENVWNDCRGDEGHPCHFGSEDHTFERRLTQVENSWSAARMRVDAVTSRLV